MTVREIADELFSKQAAEEMGQTIITIMRESFLKGVVSGQEEMRVRAAHIANEWVLACDHAGEIQRAIEALPIE